ncbi:MAG TPA: DinB family protein [Terriglobales bacterium]|nr:DinB family protein [Terriglobales bacterium]
MKTVIAPVVLLFSSLLLLAETKNPVSDVAREILPRQQKNLIAAAEAMPAEKYDFKPTPEQMSFARLVIHIAESNDHLCAKISDTPEPQSTEAKESDAKDALVSRLKASFDFCSSSLAKLEDAKLGDTVDLFGGRQGPKALALFALTNDWADHYSAAAMYLRLNGILPPTAKKK